MNNLDWNCGISRTLSVDASSGSAVHTVSTCRSRAAPTAHPCDLGRTAEPGAIMTGDGRSACAAFGDLRQRQRVGRAPGRDGRARRVRTTATRSPTATTRGRRNSPTPSGSASAHRYRCSPCSAVPAQTSSRSVPHPGERCRRLLGQRAHPRRRSRRARAHGGHQAHRAPDAGRQAPTGSAARAAGVAGRRAPPTAEGAVDHAVDRVGHAVHRGRDRRARATTPIGPGCSSTSTGRGSPTPRPRSVATCAASPSTPASM